MLSLDHESLVELFRQRSELVPALLRAYAAIDVGHHHVEPAPSEAAVVPTQFRADSVVRLCGPDGETAAAVVVEIQLNRDNGKRFTWPLYITSARAQLRCPVFLLVVTRKPDVAAWARKAIEIGQPGFVLHPSVITLPEMPRIVNAIEAKRLPELAVLSALAHQDLDAAIVALAAISDLPERDHELYKDTIMSNLSPEILEALQRDPDPTRWKYDTPHDAKVAKYIYQLAQREALYFALMSVVRDKRIRFSADNKTLLWRTLDARALTALNVALSRITTAAEGRALLDKALQAPPKAAASRKRRSTKR